jgi:DNA repair protein RadC
LANATYEEIVAKRIPGIGETKALQIVAAIEFGRRCSYSELTKLKQCNEKYIQSSEDVYNILMPLIYGSRQELFYVFLLGPRNKVIGEPREIAKGQRDEVALQPNLVFELALKEGAKAIIVAHNHPSGDPIPSDGDIEMTRKLIDAGHLMNVPLLDHLIIGEPRENHLGFFSVAASKIVHF